METKIHHIEQIINMKFVAKTIATAATTAALGPAAVPAGATVYLASKVAQKFCDNEEVKETLEFVSDIGGRSAMGGELGAIVGAASCHVLKEFGHAAVNVISDERTRTILSETTEKAISYRQTTCETFKKVESLVDSPNNKENIENETTINANSSGIKLLLFIIIIILLTLKK